MKTKRSPKKIRVSMHTRFVAVFSIALPLFILGWVGFFKIIQNNLKKTVQEDIVFTIVLNKDINETQIDNLKKKITREPSVKNVRYISPTEALGELKEELGEDPMQVLGYNPLYPSLEINLKSAYMHPDSIAQVDSIIKGMDGINNFSYRKDLLQDLDTGIKKISYVLLIVMIIMLIIAIVQINNTTHLAIYAKRFLIRSMTLLGAKYGLIIRPFLKYSVFNGFLGGLVADLLLVLSLIGIDLYFSKNMMTYISYHYIAIVCIALPLLGILLSGITSYFSTKRYIRMDGSRIVLS